MTIKMQIIFLQELKRGLFTRTPILAVLLLILVVTACGGGGGGGGSTSRVPTIDRITTADCIFAEDAGGAIGGTKDCKLLDLPKVFNSITTYNITVGEVLAGKEINTTKLGLGNFTFMQIIQGDTSNYDVVNFDPAEKQLTLSVNVTAINITINDIDENVFGEFYIDLVKSDDAKVTVHYTISITAQNDAPTFSVVSGYEGQFTPANSTTLANYDFAGFFINAAAGYPVGSVLATDIDSDTIRYRISDEYNRNNGPAVNNNLFQISSIGEITLITPVADLGEYQFNAAASDDQGGSITATIYVTVSDLSPPTFSPTTYNFNLPLSMANAGVVVGNISAMNAEGVALDYSLVGNNNIFGDLFEPATTDNADGTRNIVLRRAAILSDFVVSSVIFQVVATNQFGGYKSNANVTVNLNNDLQLNDDFDGDKVRGFYDAFPYDADVDVTGNGEPGTPYIISNIYQLQAIAGVDHNGTALSSSDFTNNRFLYGTDADDQLTKYYMLANDINASATNTDVWDKPAVTSYIGRGWTPIAGKDGQSFSGSFNGEGYAVNDLTIHLRQGDNSKWFGLFGINNGDITALGLQNINMIIQAPGNAYRETTTVDTIISGSHAGGLVALNQEDGVISYSYATGLVNASMDSIGGLVGLNQGEISYSYSTAVVQGEGDTGGLVGTNQGGALLSSYATGSVRGGYGISGREGTAGGLAGSISGVGAIINTSYAAGLVTAMMREERDNTLLGGVVAERNQTTGNGVIIEESYFDASVPGVTRPGVGKDRSNTIDGDSTGTTGFSTGRLRGCELNGLRIEGFTLVSEGECAVLFPSTNWGNTTDSTAGTDITRSWSFNAGQYPSLRVVRSPDDRDLLPSAADQECQRNGMPLGCE